MVSGSILSLAYIQDVEVVVNFFTEYCRTETLVTLKHCSSVTRSIRSFQIVIGLNEHGWFSTKSHGGIRTVPPWEIAIFHMDKWLHSHGGNVAIST